MAIGDQFDGMDESGNKFSCTLVETGTECARISLAIRKPLDYIVEGQSATDEKIDALPRIALIQALPKGQKMDLIVRQAAEMGIEFIVPIETSHCVSREALESDRKAKLGRRLKIVTEAKQQSGSAVLTKVLATIAATSLRGTLEEIGFTGPDSLLLICHESAQYVSQDLHGYLGTNPTTVAVLIGPEGGFAEKETAFFMDLGFKPVHFGGTILRTETAAAYALAAIRTITMERNSWNPSK